MRSPLSRQIRITCSLESIILNERDVTYASGDPSILKKAFHSLQGTELWMPSIDTGSESTTWWDRFFHMIHAVEALLYRGTYSSPSVAKDTPDSYSSEDLPIRVFFLAIWCKIAPKFLAWHHACRKNSEKNNNKSPENFKLKENLG